MGRLPRSRAASAGRARRAQRDPRRDRASPARDTSRGAVRAVPLCARLVRELGLDEGDSGAAVQVQVRADDLERCPAHSRRARCTLASRMLKPAPSKCPQMRANRSTLVGRVDENLDPRRARTGAPDDWLLRPAPGRSTRRCQAISPASWRGKVADLERLPERRLRCLAAATRVEQLARLELARLDLGPPMCGCAERARDDAVQVLEQLVLPGVSRLFGAGARGCRRPSAGTAR